MSEANAKYRGVIIIALIFMGMTLLAKYAMDFLRKTETETEVQVQKVLDGDTVKLEDGRLIRLIGVDCPEFNKEEGNELDASKLKIPYPHFVSYAKKAKDYLETRVDQGPLKMVMDPAFKNFVDPSGRSWAYFNKGGRSINQDMIRQGYCFLHQGYQFRDRKAFFQAQNQAKAEKRGLWNQAN